MRLEKALQSPGFPQAEAIRKQEPRAPEPKAKKDPLKLEIAPKLETASKPVVAPSPSILVADASVKTPPAPTPIDPATEPDFNLDKQSPLPKNEEDEVGKDPLTLTGAQGETTAAAVESAKSEGDVPVSAPAAVVDVGADKPPTSELVAPAPSPVTSLLDDGTKGSGELPAPPSTIESLSPSVDLGKPETLAKSPTDPAAKVPATASELPAPTPVTSQEQAPAPSTTPPLAPATDPKLTADVSTPPTHPTPSGIENPATDQGPNPSAGTPTPEAVATPKPTEIPNLTPTGSVTDPSTPVAPAPIPTSATDKGNWIKIPTAGRGRMLDPEDRLSPEPSLPKSAPTFVDVSANRDANSRAVASTAESASDPSEGVDSLLHKVQRGENLWTISRLYYGYGWCYKALWQANKTTVPALDKLFVGQTIRIPAPEALDQGLVESTRKEIENDRRAKGIASSSGTKNATSPTSVRTPLRRASRSSPEIDPHENTGAGEVKVALPTSDPFGKRGGTDFESVNDESNSQSRSKGLKYKIRKNETLRTIARDTLGDSRRANEIYELNQAVIDDRNHLITGQIIELPEDAVDRTARRSR